MCTFIEFKTCFILETDDLVQLSILNDYISFDPLYVRKLRDLVLVNLGMFPIAV